MKKNLAWFLLILSYNNFHTIPGHHPLKSTRPSQNLLENNTHHKP